ncbi:protein of unknown function [Pararobbsia alpina]
MRAGKRAAAIVSLVQSAKVNGSRLPQPLVPVSLPNTMPYLAQMTSTPSRIPVSIIRAHR